MEEDLPDGPKPCRRIGCEVRPAGRAKRCAEASGVRLQVRADGTIGVGPEERRRMETQEERVQRAVRERVDVVPYDPRWPALFLEEKEHLRSCLPAELIGRIEHFGSTAVPGLAAKPIIDVLVEVPNLEDAKRRIVPILESQGYEYFWRPTWGDDTPPFYAWFIKRDSQGKRTHHIHMVEPDFEHWDRLLFRDYLIEHPELAREYERLKLELSKDHHGDRVAYTQAKTDFIAAVTERAKEHYGTVQGGDEPYQ
jgi:GrpB-like predicted nucleotidyltransferase (UPF0157 family)